MALECIKGSEIDFESIEKVNKVVFNEENSVEKMKNRLATYRNCFISLCKDEGKVAGYAFGYEKKGKYYLWMMGVLPEHRGKGIGKKLLAHQESFAREQGYDSMYVKSSNKWKSMLVLLLKNGFDFIGFKENEWKNSPALWLEKKLK